MTMLLRAFLLPGVTNNIVVVQHVWYGSTTPRAVLCWVAVPQPRHVQTAVKIDAFELTAFEHAWDDILPQDVLFVLGSGLGNDSRVG